MTWTQYVFIFAMFSAASFIVSRLAIWCLLSRWFSRLEKWETDEVFVNCGALGFGLSFALSLTLFLDGFDLIVVSLSIVFGYLIWPFLIFVIVAVAIGARWAGKKLDANLSCTFGKADK